MLKLLFKGVQLTSSLILGTLIFVFVLFYDGTALVVNKIKTKLGLKQLTDFRSEDEHNLAIPFPEELSSTLYAPLTAQLLNQDTLVVEIPDELDENAKSILLSIQLVQPLSSPSVEVELMLSGKNEEPETIFLFTTPLAAKDCHQYPEAQLWYPVPSDRYLFIQGIDVQPSTIPLPISRLHTSILEFRL